MNTDILINGNTVEEVMSMVAFSDMVTEIQYFNLLDTVELYSKQLDSTFIVNGEQAYTLFFNLCNAIDNFVDNTSSNAKYVVIDMNLYKKDKNRYTLLTCSFMNTDFEYINGNKGYSVNIQYNNCNNGILVKGNMISYEKAVDINFVIQNKELDKMYEESKIDHQRILMYLLRDRKIYYKSFFELLEHLENDSNAIR